MTHSTAKPAIPAALPGNLEVEARLTLDQVSVLTGLRRTKIYAEIPLLPTPCGTQVHLDLLVRNGAGEVSIVRTGRLNFACVY